MNKDKVIVKKDARALRSHINNLFGDLLTRHDITEIVINKIGQIRYETKSGWQIGTEEENERVTKDNLNFFVNASATYSNNILNENHPIMSADLPDGERLQVVIPPACDKSQYSITIRKPSQFTITLDDFSNQGFFDDIVLGEYVDPVDSELQKLLSEKQYKAFFSLAVACGTKNIVIAGATGSGKTTFMKSLIYSIPADQRIITIEDVREITSTIHDNMVNLLYSSENQSVINPSVLLKSCLRMKPDRILLAELRSGEAFDYINVISSGHGGSLTSLHAGSYEQVITRLTMMSLQNPTGSKIPYDTTKEIIRDTVDIVIHIGNINGKRRITTIFWKDYKND